MDLSSLKLQVLTGTEGVEVVLKVIVPKFPSVLVLILNHFTTKYGKGGEPSITLSKTADLV